MGNKNNEFGQSLIESTLSKMEDFLKTTKLGNYLKFDPIKKFMRFSNIQKDAEKTNLPFALLKNTTSNTLGKGAGFVAGIGTFAATKSTVLSTSADIAMDAAVSTGVNKSFDSTYENTEKATKAYLKEYIKERSKFNQNDGFGTSYDGFKHQQQVNSKLGFDPNQATLNANLMGHATPAVAAKVKRPYDPRANTYAKATNLIGHSTPAVAAKVMQPTKTVSAVIVGTTLLPPTPMMMLNFAVDAQGNTDKANQAAMDALTGNSTLANAEAAINISNIVVTPPSGNGGGDGGSSNFWDQLWNAVVNIFSSFLGGGSGGGYSLNVEGGGSNSSTYAKRYNGNVDYSDGINYDETNWEHGGFSEDGFV